MPISFDPHTAALTGFHLVEAGAGTGKTYAIETLFVRMVVERDLAVQQILVVTYTIAATQELKSRIRKKLSAVKAVLDERCEVDEAVQALCRGWADAPGIDKARKRLSLALSDFDQVAIYTIHAFCQRILSENAFDALAPMDAELQTDPTSYYQEIVEDFWRERLRHQPKEILNYCLRIWQGEAGLLALLKIPLDTEDRIVPEVDSQGVPDLIADYKTCLETVHTAWPTQKPAMQACLTDAALNQNRYGRLAGQADLAGLSPREIKWRRWEQQVSIHLEQTPHILPLFADFEKFTRTCLEKSIKKGARLVLPPFCDDCQRLWDAAQSLASVLDQARIDLEIEFIRLAAESLEKRKIERRTLFFDDLLRGVERVLCAPGGSALRQTLSGRYQAALVDEFQDTDPVQFRIFKSLFNTARAACLYLIGDPKQAIYSFRGADLFAYLKAAAETNHRHTLLHNWRSQKRLVISVNRLFETAWQPFLIDAIRFQPARSPEGLDAPVYDFENAFSTWLVCGQGQRPIPSQTAELLGAQYMAQEISDLIHRPRRPVKPSDIAVLVRTNKQAELVQSVLRAKGLTGVLYSSGNVFETPQAEAMLNLLVSVADPTDEGCLRRTLSSILFDIDPGSLDLTQETARETILSYRHMMQRLNRIWQQQGVFAMLTEVITSQRVPQRLLNRPNGERWLTNIHHLAERLHQHSIEAAVGRHELIRWLAACMRRPHQTEDADQMRRENDRDAIHVITIHKSKGLEYAVVFVAFAWQGVRVQNTPVRFHADHRSSAATLDLGSAHLESHRVRSANEILAENLRLAYVALTRAREKCYLMWGRVQGAESSAMGYLLGAQAIRAQHSQSACGDPCFDWPAALNLYWRQAPPDEWRQRWYAFSQKIAGDAGDVRVLEKFPQAAPESGAGSPAAQRISEGLKRRELKRSFMSGWRMLSYSSLMQGATHSQIGDALPAENTALDELHTPSSDPQPPGSDSLFPQGIRTGLFFHEVLEHLNFAHPQYRQSPHWLHPFLQRHGFDRRWARPAQDCLEHLRQVPLGAHGKPFRLADIDPTATQTELPFYIPVRAFDAGPLAALFKRHWRRSPTHALVETLQSLGFKYDNGHLKGFIDFVFRHQGAYYLVDWKTNYLGSSVQAYARQRLEAAMLKSGYVLQYHLYALALHQMLRRHREAYDFETHFGGVYYFYLRGLNASSGTQGVFFDRPSLDFLTDLHKRFLPPQGAPS